MNIIVRLTPSSSSSCSSRKVGDPLNPDQLQQELENTILTREQLKVVEAIASSLQKKLPDKKLILAIKVALTRMPTNILNNLPTNILNNLLVTQSDLITTRTTTTTTPPPPKKRKIEK